MPHTNKKMSRAASAETIKYRGVADRVHMPGYRTDVPAFLALFDIFVMSSRQEGLCTSLMDALASLGIEAPEFTEEDKQKVKKLLPPHAPTPRNPVDFAAGGMETMEEVRVAEMLASFDYIDGLILNVPSERGFRSPSLVEQIRAMLNAFDVFSEIPKKYHKPLITQKWFFVSDTAAGHRRRVLLQHGALSGRRVSRDADVPEPTTD